MAAYADKPQEPLEVCKLILWVHNVLASIHCALPTTQGNFASLLASFLGEQDWVECM